MNMDNSTDKNTDGSPAIQIDRSVHQDRTESPTVEIGVRSSHDVPIRVDVETTVPADMDEDSIHPSVPAETWALDGEMLVFEVDLHPGEEETLLYRIDASDDVDAIGEPPSIRDFERLERDPVVDRIERSSETDDLIADVARDAAGNGSVGETDSIVDGDEDVEGIGAADSVERTDTLAEGGSAPVTTSDGEPTRPPETDHGGPSATPSSDHHEAGTAASVSNRDLIDELRSRLAADDLSREEQREIRSSLDVGPEAESIDPRLDHVQQRLSDLEAFTAPLEAIYEQRGSPDEVLFDVAERIEAIEETHEQDTEKFEAIEETVQEDAERIQSVENAVETVVEQVSDIHDRTTNLEGSVDDVEDSIEELDEAMDGVRQRVDGLDGVRSDLTEVKSDVEQLTTWQANVNSFFEQFNPDPEDS